MNRHIPPIVFPLDTLRVMPFDRRHRLRPIYTETPRRILPNGFPNRSEIAACTTQLLGKDFAVQSRMARRPEGWTLEISPVAYDRRTRRDVLLRIDTALAAAIWSVMYQTVTAERAKTYLRGEGRN